MSNQDIADALFVDEDDMAQLATQNELFKLIGVEDGDPRYSDVLLIAEWHTRKLNEAIREEWALISEVAHSANITAELFISKAREDRLAELDTINAGQPDENIRLTQESKGER